MDVIKLLTTEISTFSQPWKIIGPAVASLLDLQLHLFIKINKTGIIKILKILQLRALLKK